MTGAATLLRPIHLGLALRSLGRVIDDLEYAFFDLDLADATTRRQCMGRIRDGWYAVDAAFHRGFRVVVPPPRTPPTWRRKSGGAALIEDLRSNHELAMVALKRHQFDKFGASMMRCRYALTAFHDWLQQTEM